MDLPGQGLICLARLFAGAPSGSPGIEPDDDRAVRTYQSWAEWRKLLDARAQGEDVRRDMAEMRATGFVRWHGLNRDGLPCLWIRPSLHLPDRDPDATALLYTEVWEDGQRLADDSSKDVGGGGPFCVVYDRDGLGFFQARRNAAQCRALIGQKYYTMAGTLVDMFYHRIGVVYVVNSGFFFWSCWAFASPFLTQETRDRLVVLRHTKDLCQYIDQSQMPAPWQTAVRCTAGGGSVE